ncbi:ABC transporter permease [Sutcliffiella sp. NPDC057660]|uniref:ABC transporter permease n=1 Tax=Sutcliffiella sp. NPDC057660 TaxID=3346199 RepID=UPI00367B9BCA
MLLAFIKKDLLHLLRDKKEVMILVAMPFILITILGFALGGVTNQETKLDIAVAVVDQGDVAEDLQLLEEWMDGQNIPEAARMQIKEAAEQSSLPEILVSKVMKEELTELLTVTEEKSLSETLEEEKYAAVLSFPKNYRYEMWKRQFFDAEDKNNEFELFLNEERGLEANIVSNLVENFTEQMRLFTVLNKDAQNTGQTPPDFASFAGEIQGEKVTLDGKDPIDSFDYFAVGMSVMFALYVVSFVAGYAYHEKRTFVYDRILLANAPPWLYGASKWISAVLVVFVQLCVLFGLSALLYKVYWPDVLHFLLITLMFSGVIGSFAVLITALNYRFETERISTMFSGFLVSILAFLGGSFIPWKDVSEVMWKIGSYTPNGAALQGYLQAMQGETLGNLIDPLLTLGVTAVLLLIIAVSLFPKRRLR